MEKGHRQVFRQTSRTDTGQFPRRKITPLIHQAIALDEKEPIASEQLTEFAQRKIDAEPVFGQIKACLG